MNPNELGFSATYLQTKFSEEEWKLFDKWMYGQTTAFINGKVFYYFFDVQNFCTQYNIKYPIDKNL
jgi:hypothetical protein